MGAVLLGTFEVIILPVNDCPVVDNMIADVTANEDDPDLDRYSKYLSI